ncbi:hypothetical protein FGM00_00305 [Aggregatimonas sangjinii]|uniref:Uncharacterized protein n=1 Tax=Aggregatimonas sangjinii TaxID=2583587 RepID=A0A5B7SJN1_9FLAO|nr:hypothetical protein [Aggregatimonas sangjinii]QCW98636.1 hypothetical protein FGM00_00305 [Aggregatimonas sangjinii]
MQKSLAYGEHRFTANNLIVCIVVLCLGWSLKLNGQEKELSKYAWFDSMTGQSNSGIFKGVVYDEEFRVITDRHQFFEKAAYVSGSVVFDKQSYFDLQLRYDVFNDNLLVLNAEVVGLPAIILEKEHTEVFQLGNHRFKNIDLLYPERGKLSGFAEVLVSTDSLSLYKKHHKRLLKRTDQKTLYSEFKSTASYYFEHDNNLYRIKKATDLATVFPEQRKTIKELHDTHASLKKTDFDTYLKSVVQDLSEILNQNRPGK